MFDRVNHPARGRLGGKDGSRTSVTLDDGTVLKGKGKQFVPHGRKVSLDFPGGGYGPVSARDRQAVKQDLIRGYISEEAARDIYGLSQADIDAILNAVETGEIDI